MSNTSGVKTEKSCGAIVFRRHNNNFEFLVIKHRAIAGGHWDFPKGHVEHGESEEETAKREIYEETGLNVNFISDFREPISYSPKKEVVKTVVFFLAECFSSNVEYIFPELVDHKWLAFEEALDQLTFDNAKQVLKKANEFLTTIK